MSDIKTNYNYIEPATYFSSGFINVPVKKTNTTNIFMDTTKIIIVSTTHINDSQK